MDAWLERIQDLPVDAQLEAFEAAFDAIWRRAHRTLGDVTLTAIVDRVLYLARERFPMLGSLEVGETGLRSGALRGRTSPRIRISSTECASCWSSS